MPDGQGLCFAVRLPDGNAAKEDLPQQSESAQHAISSGQDLGTSDMPQQQQPMHFTEDSEQQQHDLANGHSAHTPAAHPGSDSALRPAGHAVYVSRSQNAAPVDVELGTTAMHET